MLKGEFRIGVNGDTSAFTALKIQRIAQVRHVVFDNSRVTRMRDSLPLHFFCRETIMSVFDARWGIGLFALLLSFLFISGLTP
jgi:hypothetical protein